jgi:ribosomal protein S18 acetylase RimI-like enzyme
MRELWLDVHPDNPAIHLYRRLGLKDVGAVDGNRRMSIAAADFDTSGVA